MLESSIHEAGVSGKLCFPRTALGDKGSSGQNQFSLALPIYREMENLNEVKETGRQKKLRQRSESQCCFFFLVGFRTFQQFCSYCCGIFFHPHPLPKTITVHIEDITINLK